MHPPPQPIVRETTKEARQRRIAERVRADDSCSPQELADAFGVSLMTMHRDLDDLQRRGLVRKFHGGVSAQPSGIFEAQVDYRLQSRTEEKQAIAALALRHIEPGMSVILDDSTTALQMIPGLAERGPLHVATTFLTGLRALSEVAAAAELTIIGLGGTYNPPHDSFVGEACIEQLEGLRVDAMFMSTSAISGTHAFHQDERIAALKRAMIHAAARRFLLVDHSKLGRVALHRIGPLEEFDLVITGSDADPAVLAAWENAGVRSQVAEP